MTDRIANPWGERTPFGAGEDWPVRVDQFLEQGVSEDEVDRWVQTASLHHANGDARMALMTMRWSFAGRPTLGFCEGSRGRSLSQLSVR